MTKETEKYLNDLRNYVLGLVPEEIPEKVIESCDNCGEEGYGKAWYGHGQPTHDSYGDRYIPLGSVVFCKECSPDYQIGKEYNGEEIWKITSERPEHSQIRINSITKQDSKAIGGNAAREEMIKNIKEADFEPLI